MQKYKVLYDIKLLENLIVRTFVNDMMLQTEKNKIFPTPTQMQIIEYIMEAKEEVYQKDLENVLNLRRATVSGVLQTMEKNDLIKRISSDKDARVKKIILNDSTKKLFLEHKNKLEEIEKLIIENIKEDDLNIFSTVLRTMKDNINKYLFNQDASIALKKGDK